MTAHHRRMHGNDPTIDWIQMLVSQTVNQSQVYYVSFLWTTKRCPCPFPGCPVSSRTWNFLRSHFNKQHWRDMIRILDEHPNPLPRCEQCRSQVLTGRLNNRHYTSEKCKQGEEIFSGARPYNTSSNQGGSRSRSTPRPYHRWRCSHTWDRQSSTTTAIGRPYN